MEQLERLIRSAQRVEQAGRHRNREGAPSYRRPLVEQTVQVLTTGTLGDTYYARGDRLGREAIAVLVRAREDCPEFLARATVWARREGLLRTLPVLGLAVLSGGRGRTKALFDAVFDRVVLIPDDLRAFVALCRSGIIPGRSGLGGCAAAAVRRWLSGLSEYHAVKYGSAASRTVTLRDVIRMTHPRAATPALAERFGWLVRGSSAFGLDPAANPQIRAFEALKQATTEAGSLALIREGRLPFEVVLPTLKATTPALWSELLRQAPYGNLLRNLATFTRHEVFRDEANVRYAVTRLTDPHAVERSMVLPFRFFDAWKRFVVSGGDARLADALRAALELSFGNLPSLGARTVCLGTDVSGSMVGSVSARGVTRYIDIAGVFTGALLKRIEGRVIALPFSDTVYPQCGLSARDDILVTAERIARLGGGGTAIGAPVEHLLRTKTRVDVFICITDHEEWAYGYGMRCSGSFRSLWRRYRREVAPEAQAFLVTIAPYRDAVTPVEKGVHYIYGWSAAVPRYIALALDAGDSQQRAIEAIPIDAAGADNGSMPEIGGEDAQLEDDA